MTDLVWHYTCGHAADRIDAVGRLEPRPIVGESKLPAVVWATDLEWPDERTLFGERVVTTCDRLEHRYAFDGRLAVPWRRFVRDAADADLSNVARMLSAATGVEHRRWFVAPGWVTVGERETRTA